MNFKISDLIISITFICLLIGTNFMQTYLKNDPQIYMLLFGLITLTSFFAKNPFKTSIPFYILLSIIFFVNVNILTSIIVDIIYPNDGWIIDENGEQFRVMAMNWIWGIIIGFITTPLFIILYHKKINRNSVLEIGFTILFMNSTTLIYIIYEIF